MICAFYFGGYGRLTDATKIGSIIIANFLKLPVRKYKSIIEKLEGSVLIKGISKDRDDSNESNPLMSLECLSEEHMSIESSDRPDKVIAEIVKNTEGFTIRYTFEGFNRIYNINGMPDSEILYRSMHINSRNRLTHNVIKGIIEHQKKFFETCDPFDLVAFSQTQLAKWISGISLLKIDISWVCRLINGLSLIIPSGEEMSLKSFFQTRKDINKRLIRKIIDREHEEIAPGMINKTLADGDIRAKLENEYGVKISRHSIYFCRKEMGIPNAGRRLSCDKYPPLQVTFSPIYPLMTDSVKSSAPFLSGVYELRLKNREIEYPNGKTHVIYIGCTVNIRKRLKEHLKGKNKNGHIKYFLSNFQCFFRYLLFPENWREEEGRLYRLFIITYGAPPKCNQISPYYEQ